MSLSPHAGTLQETRVVTALRGAMNEASDLELRRDFYERDVIA